MTRLLVLRPEPGASATVQRARERGLDAISVPLFTIEPVAWEPPEATCFDGLLLTSANAVPSVGGAVRALPLYAVGESTAQAARSAGLTVEAVGASRVDELLESIDPKLKLLHLCGEDRRAPQDPSRRITAIPVYRARAIDKPDLRIAEDTVALIHSPRAGRRFRELVQSRAAVSIAAISAAAAEAVGDGWAAVEYAAQPNDDALLALAASLCNNPRP